MSFCGGLAQFKIQQTLMKLAIKWTKEVEKKQIDAETKDEKKEKDTEKKVENFLPRALPGG